LIGPNAERGHIQGGGSARVRASRPAPILGTLRARGLDVTFEKGCSIDKHLPVVRGTFTVEHNAPDGTTAREDTDRLQFLWQDEPTPGIPLVGSRASVSGTFVPSETGDWMFGLVAVGPAVLKVNGEIVADLSIPQIGEAFFGMGSPEIRGTIALEEGVAATVEVEIEALERPMLRGLVVGAAPPAREDGLELAARAAAAADVAIVVVGTNDDWETEGHDRKEMDLPGAQDELVRLVAAANPNTIVVINAGSPVSMPWLDSVAAVMQIWFPGEEVGNALADILLGDAEPGGRLPVTMPRRIADTPAYLSHPGEDGLARYDERQFIGYRWYDARDIDPLFPFGHGLGYTTWQLGEAAIAGTPDEGVTVRVPVTNTGTRPGATVVQCYVEPASSSPRRPIRELRAFRKVTLAPGESTTVELTLAPRAFSIWSVERHDWWTPPGDYRILVGESSRSLAPAGEVTAAAP
jgi:beta-glucosidase